MKALSRWIKEQRDFTQNKLTICNGKISDDFTLPTWEYSKEQRSILRMLECLELILASDDKTLIDKFETILNK